MKDSELRGLVLRAVYDRRKDNLVSFEKLVPDVSNSEVSRILRQLEDEHLIEWTFKNVSTMLGSGQITSYGTKVIEGAAAPPIAITMIDNSIKVTDSSGVQIGQGNVQNVTLDIEKLMVAIDHSNVSDPEKKEAKSLLRSALDNSTVMEVLGKAIKAATGLGA